MGLKGGEKITDITLDRVFIGSCTNGRIEDLREVAKVVAGRQVNANVRAMIVPGSGLVKAAGRGRRPRRDLQGRGLRVARARLLDVPRHEPRSAQPPRALRLDLEPQFRGPPGHGSAAPISSRRPWPRLPRSPAASSTSANSTRRRDMSSLVQRIRGSRHRLRRLGGARQGREPRAARRARRSEALMARARRRDRRRPHRARLCPARRQGHRERHHRSDARRGARSSPPSAGSAMSRPHAPRPRISPFPT